MNANTSVADFFKNVFSFKSAVESDEAIDAGFLPVAKLSIIDGIFYSLMLGLGETYVVAFALALGLDVRVASLLAVIPLVSGSFFQLLSGFLWHHLFSPRKWVVGCAVVQTIALLMIGIGSLLLRDDKDLVTVWLFTVTTIYWSAALATGPVWNAWIGHLIPENRRVAFFINRSRFIQIATLAGLTIAGLALHYGTSGGWKIETFVVMFIVAGICRFASLVTLVKHPDVPAAAKAGLAHDKRTTFWKWIGNYPVSLMIFFGFLTNFATFFSAPYFTPFMLKQLKLDYLSFSMLIGISFVARVVTANLMTRLGLRFGVRTLLVIGVLGIIPIPMLWSFSQSFTYLLALQFATGFIWGCHELGLTLYLMETMPHFDRARLLSWIQVFNSLGMLIGSLAAVTYIGSRVINDGLYYEVFTVSSGLRILPLALFIFWSPKVMRMRRLMVRVVGLRANGHAIVKPILHRMEKMAKWKHK